MKAALGQFFFHLGFGGRCVVWVFLKWIYFLITLLQLFFLLCLLSLLWLALFWIFQFHFKVLSFAWIFYTFWILLRLVFLKSTCVTGGSGQALQWELAWCDDDCVLVNHFWHFLLFFLTLHFMLRIPNYFCYFVLKVLYLHSQLLFLFAQLVPRLPQAVDHDVAGNFQKKVHDVIFIG